MFKGTIMTKSAYKKCRRPKKCVFSDCFSGDHLEKVSLDGQTKQYIHLKK